MTVSSPHQPTLPPVKCMQAMASVALTGHQHHQRGAAIIAALLILLMVTLIGTAGIEGSISETRMALNFRDRSMAVAAATSGANAAVTWMSNQNSQPAAMAAGTNWQSAASCTGTGSYPLWNDAGPGFGTETVVTAGWAAWTAVSNPYCGTSANGGTMGSNYFAAPRAYIQTVAPPTQDGSAKQVADNLSGDPNKPTWRYFEMFSSGMGFRSESRSVVKIIFRKLY